MEASRQIYWNVDGSTIVVMYLMAGLAMGILVWGLLRATAFLRLGKPLKRDDQFLKRLLYAKLQVLAQIRVRYDRVAGVAHSLFFWGFVALTLGTVLVFLQADLLNPLFHVTFLKGNF